MHNMQQPAQETNALIYSKQPCNSLNRLVRSLITTFSNNPRHYMITYIIIQ